MLEKTALRTSVSCSDQQKKTARRVSILRLPRGPGFCTSQVKTGNIQIVPGCSKFEVVWQFQIFHQSQAAVSYKNTEECSIFLLQGMCFSCLQVLNKASWFWGPLLSSSRIQLLDSLKQVGTSLCRSSIRSCSAHILCV